MDDANGLLRNCVPPPRLEQAAVTEAWTNARDCATSALLRGFPVGIQADRLVAYLTFKNVFSSGQCVFRTDLPHPCYYCEVQQYDFLRMFPPFHHRWSIGIRLTRQQPMVVERVSVSYAIGPGP